MQKNEHDFVLTLTLNTYTNKLRFNCKFNLSTFEQLHYVIPL